jgi:hypothetical protein
MVNALTIEPSRGVLFAATQDAGLHASPDGGRTWERRDRGIAESRVWTVQYPDAPGQPRLYAGTEPAHLYVSDDLGASWSELAAMRDVPTVGEWFFPAGGPSRGHVKHVSFAPRDPATIYASIEVGGALKSTDGGRTWRELAGFYKDVHRVLPLASDPRHVYLDPLVIHPERESVIYFGGSCTNPRYWYDTHTTTSKFLKSVDGGATWQVLGPGLPDPIPGSVEGLPGVGKDYHVAMLTPVAS